MRRQHSPINQTSAIVVLGGGLLQCPLVTAVNSLGCCAIVVDQNPQCHARHMAYIFLCISISKHKDILASLQCLNHYVEIIDVQTIGTDFTFQRNYLRRKLNVERMSAYHTLASNHKYHMRRFLETLSIPIPVWKKIHTEQQLSNMVTQFNQVVLKPVDNMGARGVALLNDTSDIKLQLDATLQNSSVPYALAESVIPGQEYSVDVVVHNRIVKWCGIAQRVIILRPYFIEIGHYFSSSIPRPVISSLKKTIRKVVRAIPARHYQLKFDIFYAHGITYVNEFASRLSGGFMSGWTYPLYAGIRPAELILKHHAAKRLTLKRHAPKQHLRSLIERILLSRGIIPLRAIVVAEGSVISIPGIVGELASLPKIRAINEVVAVFAEISHGSIVRFPQNNIDKCFHIIIAAHRARYHHIFMKIRAYLLPRMAPHNNATERFLWGKQPNGHVGHCAYILNDLSYHNTIVALVSDLATTATLTTPIVDALKMFEPLCDWHGISLSLAIKIMFWKYRLVQFRSNVSQIKRVVAALLKGGLQGARYYIDTIHSESSVAVAYVDKINH